MSLWKHGAYYVAIQAKEFIIFETKVPEYKLEAAGVQKKEDEEGRSRKSRRNRKRSRWP